MAQGTRGRRGGLGTLPAVGEAGLADAVAKLGDCWVLEVFEADAAGDELWGGKQVSSSHSFGSQREGRAALLSWSPHPLQHLL